MEQGKYKLKLRAREVWWHWGTEEEVLENKLRTKTLPSGPKPPVMFASEDELIFRLEEQARIGV